VSGVTSRVPLVFDRAAFRAELVAALVDGDEIDLHFAKKLADEEEREAALALLRLRLAGVQAGLDQAEAGLEELRG
jgi:hypothetical protein